MARAVSLLLAIAFVASLSASSVVLRKGDPPLDGKDYLVSDADFRRILMVSRQRFQLEHNTSNSIYRVHVLTAQRVQVLYGDPNSTAVFWLIVKRTPDGWRVGGRRWAF
jgi:hypothetical protein